MAATAAAEESAGVSLHGCSFIIKSRVLQDGISFTQLEQEDRLPTSLRDCTVFLLPLNLPNEGTKMSKLRKLLTDEATCLDAGAGDRVWRLLVDASTVLTKLVQLGFGFSAASINPNDNVFTWTVVVTDEEEDNVIRTAKPKQNNGQEENCSTISIQRENPDGTRKPIRNIVIYPQPKTQPPTDNNINAGNMIRGFREIVINNRDGQPIGPLKLHPTAAHAKNATSSGSATQKPLRNFDRQLRSCINIQVRPSGSSSSTAGKSSRLMPTRASTSNKKPFFPAEPENDNEPMEIVDEVEHRRHSDDDADFAENDAVSVGNDFSDDSYSGRTAKKSTSKKPNSSQNKVPVAVSTRSVAAAKTSNHTRKKPATVRPPENDAVENPDLADTAAGQRSTSHERRTRLDASIDAVAQPKSGKNLSSSSNKVPKHDTKKKSATETEKEAVMPVDDNDDENPFRIAQLEGGSSKRLPKPPSEPLCEVTTPSYISYRDDCVVLGEPPFERLIDFNVFNELKEQYLFTLRHPQRLRDFARQVLHLAIPHNEAADYEAPYNHTGDALGDEESGNYKRVPEPFLIAIDNLVAEGWDEVNKLLSATIAKADDTSAVAPIQTTPPTKRIIRTMIEQYFRIAQKHPERQEKLRKDKHVWNQTARQRFLERKQEEEVRKQKITETLTGQKLPNDNGTAAGSKREMRPPRRVGKRKNLFAGDNQSEEQDEEGVE